MTTSKKSIKKAEKSPAMSTRSWAKGSPRTEARQAGAARKSMTAMMAELQRKEIESWANDPLLSDQIGPAVG